MARTRTTIRRVDPWSVLKFAFVANLVLLGVYLLVGAVAWSFVRRLQLIDTVCELALNVGFRRCAVDGQALFDTMLVLGLLGVVIQTGVFVFLAFLANLIFDLIGGIAVTLEDDGPRRAAGGTLARVGRGVGTTVGASRSDRTRGDTGAGATPARPARAARGGATASQPSRSSGAGNGGSDQTGVLAPAGQRSGGLGGPSRGAGGRGRATGGDRSVTQAQGEQRGRDRHPGPSAGDEDRLFGDD